MRSFIRLYSDFWRNHNNAELINLGIDAQFLAIYLQSNSHRNMLGVYFLPIQYIAIDIKESCERIQAALKKLCVIGYCQYDEMTQYVWVCNAAFEQIGNLDLKDNRLKPILATWQSLPPNLSFLEDVYQKYRDTLHLEPKDFVKISKTETESPARIIEPIALSPAVVLANPPEHTEKSIASKNDPSEGDSDTLQKGDPLPLPRGNPIPSEGGGDTLTKGYGYPFRSNKEYISNNKEDIRKKEEVEERKENIRSKEEDNNIVAQARPIVNAKPPPDEICSVKNLPAVLPNTTPVPDLKKASRYDWIIFVFKHWQEVMNHPNAKLDHNRKTIINKAFDLGYTTEQLCNAITGCSYTPHNMGQNDTGQRYDSLQLILRDADQIERFIHNYQQPPKLKPPNKADQLRQSNRRVAESWSKKTRKSMEEL